MGGGGEGGGGSVQSFFFFFLFLIYPGARKLLFKLRNTWPTFLPEQKLEVIDRHVHALDHNWPVAASSNSSSATTNIFFNPNFIEV